MARGANLSQGEEFTLKASSVVAGAVVDSLGTAVAMYGERNRFMILLSVTNCATDAGDHLDVYVDVLVSGTTWVNAAHFTQLDGDGADTQAEFAVLDASNPGTASINVTSSAAETTVRPAAFGSEMRARWTVTDTGGNSSFTFAVTGYAV